MRKLKEKISITIDNIYIEPLRETNDIYLQYNVYCNTTYIGKITKYLKENKWLIFFKSGTKHVLENVDNVYVLNWIKENYTHTPLFVLKPLITEQKFIYEVVDILNLETKCSNYIIPDEESGQFTSCNNDMSNKIIHTSLYNALHYLRKDNIKI